tara:strand:- start:733 stop:1968 length:1236 start_codon:yes stop_codon:yes gene_type:complete
MSKQNLKEDINKFVNTVSSTVTSTIDLTGDKSIFYFTLALLIVAFIIFLVMSWLFHTLNKKDAACKKLNTIYLENSKHKTNSFFRSGNNIKSEAKQSNNPANFFDNEHKSLVKNYYIKTAYNACCGDGYKNNFVNKCALEKCIELGARCLDFEIYSYNGEPIVAASTANDNSIKETYNYIKLTDVFDILRENCFEETKTSAGNDPMYLHFRIMSENKVIYDKFGEYIEEYLIKNRANIVDYEKYNYKNTTNDDILLQHIGTSNFNKKFIIMVHTLHVPILDNSKLSKYVHIRSGSKVLRFYRYEQVIAAGKNNPLMIDESHRSLIMVLPNIDNTLQNFDPLLPLNNGCQFVGMKFQNIDNNLVGYYKMFKDSGGFSFVLKPNNLRKDIIPPEDPVEGEGMNAPGTLTLGNS